MPPIKKLLLVLLRAFTCSGTSAQTTAYEEADAAYACGDFVNALRIFRALAQEGDAIAQFNPGVLLDFGQGTAPDQAQAITWYRRAAAQGHAGRSVRRSVRGASPATEGGPTRAMAPRS